MDLPKVFDSTPHDLLIAKMHTYGYSVDCLTFFYSYLLRRAQNKKQKTLSVFQTLLSGVSQGSIPGPVLCNEFVNELFLCLSKTDLLLEKLLKN